MIRVYFLLLVMSTEEKSEQSSRIMKVLGSVAALLGFLAPAAYLFGLSYHQGRLEAFGIEPDSFPLAAPDIYVLSYQTAGKFLLAIGVAAISLVKELLSPPLSYWILPGIIGCAGCLSVGVKLGKLPVSSLSPQWTITIKRWLLWLHWKTNVFTAFFLVVSIVAYGAFSVIYLVGAISFFWWAPSFGPYYKGREEAKERISVYLASGCQADSKTRWDSCITIQDEKGKVIHEGLLIAINDKEVALFKKEGSYIFKRQDVPVISRRQH